jgi:hypothetical protein
MTSSLLRLRDNVGGNVTSVDTALVFFHDIHGRKGEVLFFCSLPDTARDKCIQQVGINSDGVGRLRLALYLLAVASQVA